MKFTRQFIITGGKKALLAFYVQPRTLTGLSRSEKIQAVGDLACEKYQTDARFGRYTGVNAPRKQSARVATARQGKQHGPKDAYGTARVC